MTESQGLAALARVLGTRVRGRCAAASEALYNLLGGRSAGLTPMVAVYHRSGTRGSHWWLRNASGAILDPTAAQFRPGFLKILYRRGKGCGFQVPKKYGISKAAREILKQAEDMGVLNT